MNVSGHRTSYGAKRLTSFKLSGSAKMLPTGSTATTMRFGMRSFNLRAMPVKVPPVPALPLPAVSYPIAAIRALNNSPTHQHINFAISGLQNFLCCAIVVRKRVGGIFVLYRPDETRHCKRTCSYAPDLRCESWGFLHSSGLRHRCGTQGSQMRPQLECE